MLTCSLILWLNQSFLVNILLKAARFDPVLGLVSNRTIGGQGPNFMYPNDSIQFSTGFLFEVVTNQHYLIGDNIVVIWPRADVPNTISQTNQYVYSNLHVKSNSVASLSEKNSEGNSFESANNFKINAIVTNDNDLIISAVNEFNAVHDNYDATTNPVFSNLEGSSVDSVSPKLSGLITSFSSTNKDGDVMEEDGEAQKD